MPLSEALRAQRSVAGIFFLNGAVFSSWYARLPAIQDRLDLGPGALGIALAGAPVGLLVAQPLVGAVAARRGSRALLAAAPLFVAVVVLPALAVGATTLLLALLVVGALNGALDIAMNAQGVVVERAAGRPLFNSLHAAFSFGALAGAGLAAGAAAAGIAPFPHLAGVAVLGALAAAALTPGLLPDRGDPGGPRLARPSRRLAALGVIAFCALLAEGAVFDWSGVYMAGESGASAGIAPLGLAAFSLCMGVGRLLGDRAVGVAGTSSTARGGALFAALGLGLALARPTPVAALVGFALMGLGLSAVFPLSLRASSADEHVPGPSLAAVSTVGYMGFLVGPPAIGLLAATSDLRSALLLVCASCLVAAALATHVSPRRPAAARELETFGPADGAGRHG
jgi:predicted MFS family arabinose efflux permease